VDHFDLPMKKVDKHSTGGIGDKTSLILAPIVAAGGLAVPMISGRGLGHTGGTLDKLESIPGFNVNLSAAQFRKVLATCGCAMIGQTSEVAPADRKLYALRDVTGTVESPFLICASIMSKKLAEGIDGLILDVKTGSGAFMKKEEDAAYLANLMVETGERMGKRTVALLTDMDQPLGMYVGNSLEVVEVLEVLHGKGPQDLCDLCFELAAWMFYVGERVQNIEEGRRLARELAQSGKALQKFQEMVELQGGDPRVGEDSSRLPHSQHRMQVVSPAGGYITAIECERAGTACVILGGGRERKEDSVDPAVGFVLHKKVGHAVSKGESLATVHYNDQARGERATKMLLDSFRIGEAPPATARRLIHGVITESGGNH
jgi:pyrimidine-nucleoside phosphorylase